MITKEFWGSKLTHNHDRGSIQEILTCCILNELLLKTRFSRKSFSIRGFASRKRLLPKNGCCVILGWTTRTTSDLKMAMVVIMCIRFHLYIWPGMVEIMWRGYSGHINVTINLVMLGFIDQVWYQIAEKK